MENNEVFEAFLTTLNESVLADKWATDKLFRVRVPCNDALADHQTIQVRYNPELQGCEIGLIGIINGICEKLTGDRIALNYDDEGNFLGFVKWVKKEE
jgi:hypothetical protein